MLPGEASEAERVPSPLEYVGRKAAPSFVFLKKKKRQGLPQCTEGTVGGCRMLKEEFGQGKAWDQPKLRKVPYVRGYYYWTMSYRHILHQ